MGSSQKPPKIVVTWAVLIPLLLIITFLLSPGVIVSVFAAAIVSAIVHSAVGFFYGNGKSSNRDFASWLMGS